MELETWTAPPGDTIPNHPRWPVLIYRGVDVGDGESFLMGNGWSGTWTDGVFDYHHFHSTSHEALAVVAGSATIELGGPQGEAFAVAAGDVLVLPAGTGHRRASARGDFVVAGAYPPGFEDYDILRTADDAARDRIASVPVPPTDPAGGTGISLWT